jgi:hypothetical protein
VHRVLADGFELFLKASDLRPFGIALRLPTTYICRTLKAKDRR